MIKVLAVLSLVNVVVTPSLSVEVDVNVDVNVDGNGMHEKDYCEPNWLPERHLTSAMYGLDIAKKLTLPYKAPDASTKGMIFNGVFPCQGPGCGGCQFRPYEFYTTRKLLVCNAEFQTVAYETLEDYIVGSSHSSMNKWELGYQGPKVTGTLRAGMMELSVTPPPFSASLGSSDQESNSDYHRFFHQERGSISRSSAECSVYVIDVDIDSKKLSLHENFVNAIRNIDIAVGEKKNAQMKAFIQKYGTHYASQSVMGIGTIFETRFTEDETINYDKSVRNRCSSKSGGINLFGFKYGESHTRCSGSMNDTTVGKDTVVSRFRSTSYGTLPSESLSLEEWSSKVMEMMKAKILRPLPTNQVLHPILDILATNTVANLKNTNGTGKIDHQSLLTTAFDGYADYLHSFSQELDYQFSCADKVRIGHNTYKAQITTFHGRTIYKDDYTKNFLFFDNWSLWNVAPNFTGPDYVLTSAPCPLKSVGFFGLTPLLPPLPDTNHWKVCASTCYSNKPLCRFWQHDNKTKLCQQLTDFELMVKKSSTSNFTVGSVDCPGDKYKYASGLCPENNPSRSMLKRGQYGEMEKFLSIEGFDPTAVLIVGGQDEHTPIAYPHETDYSEVIKKGGKCNIPRLPNGGTYSGTVILTPGDNKVLYCGGLGYTSICLELNKEITAWKHHSTLPKDWEVWEAKSVTMENGVYLITWHHGKIGPNWEWDMGFLFLPRMSSSWQILSKPDGDFSSVHVSSSHCVVKTSETSFHVIGPKSFKYDIVTRKWKEVKILGLLERSGFACAMFDDSVIVTGGHFHVSGFIRVTEVIPFKNGNVAGTPRLAGSLNMNSFRHGMAVVGGKYPRVMVFGGHHDTEHVFGSIEVWQPDQEEWKIAPYVTANARYGFGLLALPDILVCPK